MGTFAETVQKKSLDCAKWNNHLKLDLPKFVLQMSL